MTQTLLPSLCGMVVEEDIHFSLAELCQASNAEPQQLQAWVFEGVLQPVGDSPRDWRFGGDSLRRARLAQRLASDLDLNPSGVALALDLLDQIAVLRQRLQGAGGGR